MNIDHAADNILGIWNREWRIRCAGTLFQITCIWRRALCYWIQQSSLPSPDDNTNQATSNTFPTPNYWAPDLKTWRLALIKFRYGCADTAFMLRSLILTHCISYFLSDVSPVTAVNHFVHSGVSNTDAAPAYKQNTSPVSELDRTTKLCR